MEQIKKKRPSEVRGDEIISGNKIRSKKDRYNPSVTTEDDELLEFLAILKRLEAGIKGFQKQAAGDDVGKSAAPPAATGSDSLNMGFELEDFIQFHDGRKVISAGDTVENVTGFGIDLNADPISDHMSD